MKGVMITGIRGGHTVYGFIEDAPKKDATEVSVFNATTLDDKENVVAYSHSTIIYLTKDTKCTLED